MTNRFRLYSFLATVVLCATIFAGFVSIFNQQFHHSKAAIALSDLPKAHSEAVVIINNHSSDQGGQIESMKRPSQVIRTDGTVLLDSKNFSAAYEYDHNAIVYLQFYYLGIYNKKQYIRANIRQEDYSESYRIYEVLPDATLQEVDIQESLIVNESMHADYITIPNTSGYWQLNHAVTAQNISTGAQTTLIQWKGFLQKNSMNVATLDKKADPERYLVMINDYAYILDSKTKQYALLTLLPFMPNFGINSIEVIIPYTE